MTKAAICTHCWDIVSPFRDWKTNRAWRWCACQHAACRWRDGNQGLLEVSALHGQDHIRVLGLNNNFLAASFKLAEPVDDRWWHDYHRATTAMVGKDYLFHEQRRNCWALLTRVGESGDVFWIDHNEVFSETPPPVSSSVVAVTANQDHPLSEGEKIHEH